MKERLMKRRTTNSAMTIEKNKQMLLAAKKERALALRKKIKNYK